MNKFIRGDRVRAYGYTHIIEGTVLEVIGSTIEIVRTCRVPPQAAPKIYLAHHKQCRKLVKKVK